MQRIFSEQLATNLTSGLQPIYFIVGDEPLLIGECFDLLTSTASKQNINEKQKITIDNNTNWNELFNQWQEFGLFSSQKFYYLILPETVTVAIQQNLAELIDLLHSDIYLALQFPKWNKAFEKQAWYLKANSMVANLKLVSCSSPEREQFANWIKARLKNMQLQADNDAIQLLCYNYEGNLLALKQNLQLLSLLHPDGKLSLTRVQDVIAQSNIFSPYQWADALLAGKLQRSLRILNTLNQEDVQPVILLRIIQRELKTLMDLMPEDASKNIDRVNTNIDLRFGFDRLKIWQKRRPLFSSAINRLSYRQIYLLWQQLLEIEKSIKLDFDQDTWLLLEQLCMKFCAQSSK